MHKCTYMHNKYLKKYKFEFILYNKLYNQIIIKLLIN